MAKYIEKAEGKYFTDFVDDPEFQKDLVRFFSGGRYQMSKDEMKQLGPQGLADKFVEHMRWQNTNELTALKDYNYVKRETTKPTELESFGNLMQAYDKADSGGTGYLSGAADYLSAFATSPSTLSTVATAGWGVGSKLAAKASGKALQLGMREAVSELVKKGIATSVIKDQLAGTLGKSAVKGAVSSAIVEGAMGAGQSALQGKTRELTGGEAYTTGDLIRDGLISATIGGALGSVSHVMDTKTQRAVVEKMAARTTENTARAAATDAAAKAALSKADPAKVSAAADRVVDVALNLESRVTRKALDPLDPKLVEKGNLLKKDILAGKVDNALTTTLSSGTMRGITAATIDIADTLNVKEGERITSAVARALGEGRVDATVLEGIRETYGLSREQFSYIYLADLSQAGKTLAEASYIAKAAGRKSKVEAATAGVKSVMGDLDVLAGHGIPTVADAEVAKTVANAYKAKDLGIIKGLRALDSTRIAFMTSQLGTTAANVVTSTFNLAVDISDNFWKNVARVTYGEKVGDKVQRRWVSGTLSTLKGMSWNRDDARMFREIVMEEMPENYSRLFYEAARAESAVEGTSRVAKLGRGVNIINASTDAVFKQGVLYSSVDRQLRELADPKLGGSLGEFIAKKLPLDSLPEGLMDKAIDDARRFTFSRSYRGDKSYFGKAAQAAIDAHHKLPFVVSAGMGTPFPRYIANHLEHINDYTPIGIITGGLNKFDGVLYGDVNKTGLDRFARQMTGASVFMLGAYTAAQSGGTLDYDKLQGETANYDLSRVAGPWLINFYLGDLYYRWKNDLPINNVKKELWDIALGSTDLKIDTTLAKELSDSIQKGEISTGLARSLGDIAATFTYPLTPTRDFLGEVRPEDGTTPYTKDIFGGSMKEVSTFGEGNFLDEMINRATRFLPEVNFMQYTQSYNGKTAIPYYSPFSADPIGTFDPLSKQFGVQSVQKPNALQKEIERLDLKEFELYTNKTVPNPAVDVIVREILGKSMPKKFEAWKSQIKQGGRFADMTYDQTPDSALKTLMLKEFINSQVESAVAQVTDGFNQLIVERPKVAAGYVRNLYVLTEDKAIKGSGDKKVYDTAVKMFTKGDYASAEDFLSASDTVEEEVGRRMHIMSWADQLAGSVEGFPDMKFQR